MLQAKNNLEGSRTFFKKLAQKEELTEVVSNELYFEVLERGDGPTLDDLSLSVCARYKVTPIEGTTERDIEPLVNTFSEWMPPTLTLADVIPGLSYGMKGMKTGEKRRIYVHPNLAYGCCSNFEGGVSLQIDIELLKIVEDKHPILPLAELRLDPPDNLASITEESLQAMKEKIAHIQGAQCWGYFKKRSDLYSLEDVAKCLVGLQSGDGALPQDKFVDLFSQLQCLLYWEGRSEAVAR